jgi:hypothetical protein
VRVFILGTGRCGTTTVAEAFKHADNYSSGHETKSDGFYDPLEYPDWHIESDSRLVWFLGELDKAYPDALYIHLIRDRETFVASIVARGSDIQYGPRSILRAFGASVLQQGERFLEHPDMVARRLWHVVNTNVEVFLRDKQHTTVWLHELTDRFSEIWEFVGAEGDLDAALAETRKRHNAGRLKQRARRPA